MAERPLIIGDSQVICQRESDGLCVRGRGETQDFKTQDARLESLEGASRGGSAGSLSVSEPERCPGLLCFTPLGLEDSGSAGVLALWSGWIAPPMKEPTERALVVVTFREP